MIPVLLSARQKDGEAAAWRLVGLVLTALLAFMAAVIVVVGLFTPFFVENLLAPGFDAATSRLTVTLTRIMLAQPLVLAVGSVATAVLNSRNRFLPTALSVVSHNVALIAGIIASGLIPGLGILGPTLGVIGGALLQVLSLIHIFLCFEVTNLAQPEAAGQLFDAGAQVAAVGAEGQVEHLGRLLLRRRRLQIGVMQGAVELDQLGRRL